MTASISLAACGGGGDATSGTGNSSIGDKAGAAHNAVPSVPAASDAAGRHAETPGVAGMAGTSARAPAPAGSASDAPTRTGAAGTNSGASGAANFSAAGANVGTAGAGGSAGSGGSSASGARPALATLKFATTKEKVMDPPVFHVTRPMDLEAPGGLLPVVAWANGGCVLSDMTWIPLFERWASAGFVVLSLTNDGPDDDIASMLGTSTKVEHAALMDWAEKANQSGPYAGKLDLDRVVVAGNSCGGVTALEVASVDMRPAAVFILSGSSALGDTDKTIMEKITVPVGYITGSLSEDVAAPNAVTDYDALKEGQPAMIVNRTAGDHPTVSTDEKILPEDAEIALNWMDLALYGTRQAYDTLTSRNVCEHCTPGDWTLKSKNLETLVK